MAFQEKTPVFIAKTHRQHGFNISRNKHTIATVLSVSNDRYHLRFMDNSTAFMNAQYLELATKEKHEDVRGWDHHFSCVRKMKSDKLSNAKNDLVKLCHQHGVKLSVEDGEVVLVDVDSSENKVVINEQYQQG